jgi:hypothetical protein
MFQNAALDIAIGLSMMYLVLSLLCTVINEFIATKLKLRSDNLKTGLQALLDDTTLRNAFYDHGLISATMTAMRDSERKDAAKQQQSSPPARQPQSEHPSYLSAETAEVPAVPAVRWHWAGGQPAEEFAQAAAAMVHSRTNSARASVCWDSRIAGW